MRRTVNAALDPNIPMLVAGSAVTGVEVSGIWLHIGLQVTLVVLVDRARNRRPWVLENEYALNVVSMKLNARDWVQKGGLDSEERHSGGPRFGLNGTWEGCDHDGSCFGLPRRRLMSSADHRKIKLRGNNIPESVYDRALHLADMLVIPIPCFRVDRLANASKDTQTGEVMAFHMMRAKTAQQANRCWCGVELGQFVFLHSLPVARRCGIYRGRFEHGC